MRKLRRKKETQEIETQNDLTLISNEESTQADFVIVFTKVGAQTNSKIQMIDVPPSLIEVETQIDPPYNLIDRGVKIEDVPLYTPLIVEASIKVLHKTMER